MINGYDFDGTIYDGDSSVDFYKYCLKRNKRVLLQLPVQIIGIIAYILGIINKTKFKEMVFSFLKKIDNIDGYISDFWEKHLKNIKEWYLESKNKTDLVISASPEFLLKPLEKTLKVKVIASKVDKKTGKFLENNCHDYEKVKRFKEEMPNTKIAAFYSDSMSDKPMMDISEKQYLVVKNAIYDLDKDRDGKLKKYLKYDKLLYKFGILFLVIPIIIQLIFWYNRLISIPCALLLLIATKFAMKKYKPLKQSEYYKMFNKKKLVFIIVFIIILNILSGAGGIFPQNWDYHGRNAIFRGLIEHSWPVKYDYSSLAYEHKIFGNTGILNYYFAFWLPGAIIGKLTSFKIASLFMLFWQTIGVLIFFYYVFRFFKNTKYRYFFIFIAFGGLNVIGQIIMNKYFGTDIKPIGSAHIDTSMGLFCMSSFITQLFWVFNQSVPAWIATMLFLQDKDYRLCGYFFALLVPFGPFPMLGLLYLIICYIIFGKNLNKLINLSRIKELLSIENIFACLSVLPIVFMYTLNESRKGCFLVDSIKNGKIGATLFCYLLFLLLEFLVYIIIINKNNYKKIIMCFMFFTIAPLFYIGGSDLGNRATIPILIVLYLLVCEYLNVFRSRKTKIFNIQVVLITILVIASITNFNEIFRSLKYGYLNHKEGISNFSDSYYSFDTFENKECAMFITNFIASDDKNNKVLQWILRK